MMNSHRNRLALAVALVSSGLLALTGCPDSTSQSVAILQPADGSVFTAADDVSDAISGVQIDVVVRATGIGDGTAVDLRVNDESVGALTWRGSDLTFGEVTIQPGENVIRAVAGSATAQITVTLEGITPCPTLEFLRPTASARLNASDDADGDAANGFQYDVQISTDAADGTSVQLLADGAAAGTATASGGSVEFSAATLLATMPAPGAAQNVTLRAQTSDACSATITVQVLGPEVPCAEFHFVEPVDGAVFGLADDENHDPSDGFQKTVTVSTNAEPGTDVELRVDGGVVASTTVVTTVVRFPDVDFSDGAHTLRVQQVEDEACGAEIGVTVETGAPTCDIVDPVGDYLNAGDDTDTTAPGLQTDFDVTSDAEAGQPVTLIIDGVETGAPTANISGGHAVFEGISLAEGVHTVRARCENAVGNVGFSGTFSYTVDTVIPTCVITDPPDGTWYNDGDDALPEVLGTQVEVGVQVTDAPVATTVAQCGFAPLDPEGIITPGVTGAGAGYVTLTGPGNQVCCAVEDAAGNAAEARITLNLDTEVPQFEIRRPDAATDLILAVDDEGPSDTLCQYTVVVGCSNIGQPVSLAINGFDHSRTETCTATGSDPLGGTATWSAITLPQGSVTLQARGESIGGLPGTSPEKVVTVDTEPPVLVMNNPPCGRVLTPADDTVGTVADGIQIPVWILASDAPVTLTVTSDGTTPVPGSPYTAGSLLGGFARFTGVTLVPAGSTFGFAHLNATATDEHGQLGSLTPSPCVLEVRDVPQVQITSPANGALLGPGDDCNPGTPAFDLGVTVTANITSGTVELFVAGSSVGSLPYSGSPVTFCVPAADGSGIAVRAEGRDIRGTGSHEIMVTIDSTPPDVSVSDLSITVADRRGGTLDLNWTAPSDAGGGPVAGYRIRCLSAPTAAASFDWDTATSYLFTGTVGAPGSPQTQRLTGFRMERFVTCMIRATDLVGSLGPLGNTPQVHLAYLTQEILGPTGTSRFGSEIELLGDLNGDTLPDFGVGTNAGTTFHVFFGSSAGAPPANWSTTITGTSGSFFGSAAAGVGDVNGDTRDDLVIGAYGVGGYKGAAYIFFGRASWPASMDLSMADVRLTMDDPGSTRDDAASFGWDVAAAGDHDGDGIRDVLVAAPGWNGGRGGVFLLFGRASIPSALTVPGDGATGFAGDRWFDGAVAGGNFGTSIVGGAALDVGMLDDFVVGEPLPATGGSVYVFLGRTRTVTTGLVTVSTPDQQILSPVAGSNVYFGNRLAMGEVSGDGRPDLLVYLSRPAGATAAVGGILVYLNTVSGLPSTSSGMIQNDVAMTTADRFGTNLANGYWKGMPTVGDMDGDGRGDVLAGMALYGGAGGSGALFVGREYSTTVNESSADLLVRPEATDTLSRAQVGFIGDVTGDGWMDFVVGHHRHAADRGRVVVVY